MNFCLLGELYRVNVDDLNYFDRKYLLFEICVMHEHELIFYDLTFNVMDNKLHRDELIKTDRDSDLCIIFVLYFIV
jgi:hypothetical protein